MKTQPPLTQLLSFPVVVLCGLPGCGKSTLAELLVEQGYTRFSSDQIRTQELFTDQHHRMNSQHELVMKSRELVYKALAQRARRAAKAGKKIVVDGTNMDEKRDLVMKALLEVVEDNLVCIAVLRPDPETIRQRFASENSQSLKDWEGLNAFWQKYLREGKASYPQTGDYQGVSVLEFT